MKTDAELYAREARQVLRYTAEIVRQTELIAARADVYGEALRFGYVVEAASCVLALAEKALRRYERKRRAP